MRCALSISTLGTWTCHAVAPRTRGALSTRNNLLSPKPTLLSPRGTFLYPRCRASGDLRRCGAEDFERTFCVVCVTRLKRSWTSIDQHFQGVCTVYSLACGKGADRFSMGKHGHECARAPGVTDAFLRSLVPECYDIIAKCSVGNSNGTVSSAEGQRGSSSG